MKITLHPYRLEFLFPFRIAHGIRTHTDAVFLELEHQGVTAYGEATLPPYLPYTQASTIARLSSIDTSLFKIPINVPQILASVNISEPPALAALDMALWTLKAKLEGTTIQKLLEIDPIKHPLRSYTIGVCDRPEMALRIASGQAAGFTFFKLKLNGQTDAQMLFDFRSLTDAPFAVDANQAWTDIGYALDFGQRLENAGCVLLEQPFYKTDRILTRRLKDALTIPIIADEACQTIEDIDGVADAFSGINVKLQKCGGISNGLTMIQKAKSIGLKVLIGCMSESIVGCSAAEALAPLCDWNDLDGPYLIKPVPFEN